MTVETENRLAHAREIASTIQDDCATDAAALDRTPFSPRGMGEALGTTLAICAGLAGVCIALADEIASLERTLNSRTEHLA